MLYFSYGSNMSRGSDRLKRSKIQLTIGEQKKWQFKLPNSVYDASGISISSPRLADLLIDAEIT